MQANILVTCIANPLGGLLVSQLRSSERLDLRLVGADVRGDAHLPSGLAKFERVPPGGSPEYVPALLSLCEKHSIDVVIPWADEEAVAIARRLDDFQNAGPICNVPPEPYASTFRSKTATYEWLEAEGLPTPRWEYARDVDGIAAAVRSLGYPNKAVVVKPADSRGGRGVWVLDSSGNTDPFGREERRHTLEEGLDAFSASAASLPALIVMEHLEGEIYDVDLLRHDDQASLVSRRRHDPFGHPLSGWTIDAHPAVLKLAENVAARFPFIGLFDLDVFVTPTGEAVLLEVNPRPSGSSVYPGAAGVPLWEALILTLLGSEFPPLPEAHGLTVVATPQLVVRESG